MPSLFMKVAASPNLCTERVQVSRLFTASAQGPGHTWVSL